MGRDMRASITFSREDREKLGRWAPGSLMPDRYDRATCTTELRLRNEILERIRSGWEPTNSFETPGTQSTTKDEAESSSASSTSETSSLLSEEDITDLWKGENVIDTDGSKGFV